MFNRVKKLQKEVDNLKNIVDKVIKGKMPKPKFKFGDKVSAKVMQYWSQITVNAIVTNCYYEGESYRYDFVGEDKETYKNYREEHLKKRK